MKAIEKEYNGYKFRSRLEARWAVFLDEMGIIYEYEKEGFTFEDGTCYLPDFYLPEFETFCEVKGTEEQYENDKHKIIDLVVESRLPVIILGNIPNPDETTTLNPIVHPVIRHISNYEVDNFCLLQYLIFQNDLYENFKNNKKWNLMPPVITDIIAFTNNKENKKNASIYWGVNDIQKVFMRYDANPNIANSFFKIQYLSDYLIFCRQNIFTLECYKKARQARFEHKDKV